MKNTSIIGHISEQETALYFSGDLEAYRHYEVEKHFQECQACEKNYLRTISLVSEFNELYPTPEALYSGQPLLQKLLFIFSFFFRVKIGILRFKDWADSAVYEGARFHRRFFGRIFRRLHARWREFRNSILVFSCLFAIIFHLANSGLRESGMGPPMPEGFSQTTPGFSFLISGLFLFIGLLFSVVSLHFLVRSPLARFFGDVPDHRKIHLTVVPRLGGLGMLSACTALIGTAYVLVTLGMLQIGHHLFAPLLFICFFLSLAGTLDDLRPLHFKLKFLLQFSLAVGLVMLFHKDFGDISILGQRFELNGFSHLLSVLWIVAVMNAFNIIDGIDGLAGGTALCGFAAVAFMAHRNDAQELLMLCTGMMGITLGFLRFNFSRRYKVFLGDTGSQFFGAILALMAMEVQSLPNTGFRLLVPILIVGYPLFDISVAMLRRFSNCKSRNLSLRFLRMFVADNEHLHHRLVCLGHSHAQTTMLLLLVAGSFSATASIISAVAQPYRLAVLGYLAVALLLILNRLGYVGLRPWLTRPRSKAAPTKVVGVIEPDEVFHHSLTSFKQDKFEFLNVSEKLGKFLDDDLLAVTLYNVPPSRFEERWTSILRDVECLGCPAVVIADYRDISKVQAINPGGFRDIFFMESPVRVPDLIKMIEDITKFKIKKRINSREKRFSLSEIAVRGHVRN